jgi:DnaJ-class molecular chaperone
MGLFERIRRLADKLGIELESLGSPPLNFEPVLPIPTGEMNDGQFFTTRCGPCYGTGHYDDETPCPACSGEGSIHLPGKIQDYVYCGGCAGSGFSGFDCHAICVRCLGAGRVKKKLAANYANHAN